MTKAINNLYADNPPSESLAKNADHITALKNFYAVLLTIPSIPDIALDAAPATLPRVAETPPLSTTPPSNYLTIHPPEPRVATQPIPQPEPLVPRRSNRERRPTYRAEEYAMSAINVDTGKLTEYRQLLKSSQGHLWDFSACEEWARLAQGLPSIGIPEKEGTNTIKFILIAKLPPN